MPFEKPVAAAPAAAPRVLAIANQKGGVGKTTTAINLGTALAAIGEHVLIVDLDPQGNASTGLGIERRRAAPRPTTCSPARRRCATRWCRPRCRSSTSRPRPWTSPASSSRSASERDRAFRLRTALNNINNGTPAFDFTYVLVDCPPSLNLLTVNAMAAADSILVPLQCEFFALEGLSQLLKTVEQVKKHAQPEPVDPRHRADHVRLAQQSVQPGGRRRAPVHGRARSTTP